ncbi:hypothetical protein [Anaerovorax sp. IOR16]|uniref:hypothetical protein n=1 Tax=Anaerovorax sp. IOR16 TaxID=2773458 RepID=UPI0019D0329E|nr:hypothetical protein [Anaerovorax sp. IOR16]
MLSKKYVVQKSFRIDAKLENDLEKLSEQLGRPQNELVNLSLENLMKDNKHWFILNALADMAEHFIEGGNDKCEFTLSNITIKLKVLEDCSVDLYYKNIHDDGEIEEFNQKFKDSPNLSETLRKRLIELGIYINIHSEDINEYLTERLNYR